MVLNFYGICRSIAILLLIALTTACDSSETYQVSTSIISGDGRITPQHATVDHGQRLELSVIPDTGFRIAMVNGCEGVLQEHSYRTGTITSNCTITVSFAPIVGTPQNVQATAGDSSITFTWVPVPEAEAHHLYYATEPDVTPSNYHRRVNGTRIADITSPYELTGLTNYTTYYAAISATLTDENGEHESNHVIEIAARPAPPFKPIGGLNDTGVNWCRDRSEEQKDCPSADFPGQDGDHGRDLLAREGKLPKIGSGPSGFDFTKLGSDGSVLPIQDRNWDGQGSESQGTRWSCVRDNVSGLVWEIKTNDPTHIQHREHTFTWYNPDDTSNGGAPGVEDGGECARKNSKCDTHSYIQALNDLGVCGANDWRLPTRMELQSIADISVQYPGPTFDTNFFPNTLSGWGHEYWTSTPSSSIAGQEKDFKRAWFVSNVTGLANTGHKGFPSRVRLVRGPVGSSSEPERVSN